LASTNEKWGLPPGPTSAPSPDEVLLGDLEDRCNMPLKRTSRDKRSEKVVKLKRTKDGAGLKGLAGERRSKKSSSSESEEGRRGFDGARGWEGDEKISSASEGDGIVAIPALSKETIFLSAVVTFVVKRSCAALGLSWVKSTVVWPVVLVTCSMMRKGKTKP